jgi:hypothetical protein
MNDPNLFALSIMMIGLLWFLHLDPKQRAEGPFLVMVLGGFFKHSLFAIPATALYMLARRNRPLAMRAMLVAGCTAGAGIGLFTLLYGRPFLDQIFFYPREFLVQRAWDSLGRLGSTFPALLVWSIWAWHEPKSKAVEFTATFLAFSFIAYLLQKLGAGTDINAQFEMNTALAIGVGLAFERIDSVPIFGRLDIEVRPIAVVALLALGLLAAPGLEPYFLASTAYRTQFSHNVEIMRSEVLRIAAIPGKVWCSIDTVCRAAGKPFVIDVFFLGQRAATGRMAPGQLAAELTAQGIAYERIDPRAATGPLQKQFFYGRSRQR